MNRLLTAMACVVCVLSSCGEPGPMITGLPFSEYTHEDEPFAEELFAEHAAIPVVDDTELIWLLADLDRAYTHVRDLERTSYRSADEGLDVWFLGGSTTFGVGQRDEHTIPSQIVRLAEANGTPIRASNFGVSSYLSWQEAGLFRRLLTQRSAPDLVVVYHGINDMGAICRQLALGEEPDALGNPLLGEAPDEAKESCTEIPERTGELLARATSRAMVDARAAAGSTPVIEFWQPFAATRSPKSSDGPLQERLGVDADGLKPQGLPYRAAIDFMDEPPVDLTDALDDHDGPVYFDWAHTNELGARIIAETMWERSLREAVEALHEPPG